MNTTIIAALRGAPNLCPVGDIVHGVRAFREVLLVSPWIRDAALGRYPFLLHELRFGAVAAPAIGTVWRTRRRLGYRDICPPAVATAVRALHAFLRCRLCLRNESREDTLQKGNISKQLATSTLFERNSTIVLPLPNSGRPPTTTFLGSEGISFFFKRHLMLEHSHH